MSKCSYNFNNDEKDTTRIQVYLFASDVVMRAELGDVLFIYYVH